MNRKTLLSMIVSMLIFTACGRGLDVPVISSNPGATVTPAPAVLSLTSVDFSAHVPTGVGTLLNQIWASGSPKIENASAGNSAPGCPSAVTLSQIDINANFGSTGQTATGWTPGTSPGIAGNLVLRCVRLCTDLAETLCTNWVYATGT